ncbi:MAG: hypothetical protein ACM3WS_08120 [Bacillota bacterium]
MTKSTTELIERLRKHAALADKTGRPHCNLLHEAADCIEELAGRPAAPGERSKAECDGGTCGVGGYCDDCPKLNQACGAEQRELPPLPRPANPNDIDDRYAGRLAMLLECMLIDPNRFWNEAAQLLDEYKAEWEKVNPQPPTFMGEPMPPERKARLLALRAAREIAAAPSTEKKE